MAPRRRGLASAKRQQQTQPSQSGIQRFFSTGDARITPAVEPNSQSLTPPQGTNFKPPSAGNLQPQKKQLRISPGALIQPSQDDGGGDQVVWKFSPTADRLQEASTVDNAFHTSMATVPAPQISKRSRSLPNVQEIFIERTSLGSSGPLMPRKKRSPNLAGKLEQWLSSTNVLLRDECGAAKATSKCATLQSQQASDWHQQTPASWDKENNVAAALSSGPGHILNAQKSSQGQGHSVCSSARRRSLVGKVQKKKNLKQRGLGQRRKALLELLDQVQNVMSDPESVSSHAEGDAAVVERNKVVKSVAVFMEEVPEAVTELVCTTSMRPCSPLLKKSSLLGDGCAAEVKDLTPTVSKAFVNTGDVEALLQQLDETDCFLAIPETLASVHFLVLEVADIVDRIGGSGCSKKVLRLLNEYSGLERILYLVDEWFFTVVRPGDTVNVIGDFNSDGTCIIDRNHNLLVVHPDVLISGSKVGTSFTCPRRAVLEDRIRSSSVAFPALLGTMMHELFQVGLVNKAASKLLLEQEAEILVHRNIDSLFACGGNEKDALSKLKDCIPTILNWLDSFLCAPIKEKPSAWPKVDFGRKDNELAVSVDEVMDIEEMIYSPKFGLKGMIDASLLVKFDSLTVGCSRQILPLEFKTGKLTTGQAALEHRAQVIMYSLLMSDRYQKSIDNGLLYYLQPNQTQGVAIQRGDLLGLVMRRNEHATNLSAASLTQQLPPVLQSMHLCERCWHVDACSVYHKAEGGTVESSGLGEIFNQKTDHLGASHVEFLKLWDRLIDLEAQELQSSQREIWRLPSQEREKSGGCLSTMKLNHQADECLNEQRKIGAFVYSFSKDVAYTRSNKKASQRDQASGLHERSFSCGDHVLLSTENGHVAVAAGSICEITEESVLIKLSHRLRLPQQKGKSDEDVLHGQLWRIDKDETASFLAAMRFNVLQLCLKSGHDQGRRLIVDLEPPRFDMGGLFSQDPASLYVRSASELNDDQRRAIFRILSARDYALVLGMPGTGKTSTIVHAVKALLTRGSSILLTSYTNSAVDNILLKLKKQGVDFVRLGRENAIHPDLKDHMVDGFGVNTVEDLEQRMNAVRVVAVTCLGVTHPLLTDRKFDVCVVDEAGQITLPVCLGPLRFANVFVLVGDHYQLPPLVRNAEARERGLAVSLFKRLSEAHPQAIAALQCQYRMSAGIMSLSNALIYGDRLRCGSTEVANGRLEYMKDIALCAPSWLQKVLDAAKSVVFVNTDLLNVQEEQCRSTTYNVFEASIVVMVAAQLLQLGVESKDIGVISPYNYQVQHIRRLLASSGIAALEVHTIDRFQGRDKECVLVSFVKTSLKGRNSSTLLADWHRINVAITRAKKKLVLVGSQKTLCSTPVINLLIKQVNQMGGLIDIPQDAKFLLGGLTRCQTPGVTMQGEGA